MTKSIFTIALALGLSASAFADSPTGQKNYRGRVTSRINHDTRASLVTIEGPAATRLLQMMDANETGISVRGNDIVCYRSRTGGKRDTRCYIQVDQHGNISAAE